MPDKRIQMLMTFSIEEEVERRELPGEGIFGGRYQVRATQLQRK